MNGRVARRWVVGMLVLAAGGVAWSWTRAGEKTPPPGGPKTEKLVGTWKLVAIDERDAEGRPVTPLDYGPEPIGMLMYDASGHMSVHAMRRGRPRLDSDDVHRATPEQAKAAFVGYGAYFGTYEVDEQAGVVTHHVQGSLIPNWEGSKQRRRFTLAGDKLVLEPPEIQAAGQKRTRRLTWQRVSAGLITNHGLTPKPCGLITNHGLTPKP